MRTISRRMTALKRAGARRERMEPELRGALDARRREHAELQARVEHTTARLAELDAIVARQRARIAGMMTGAEPFAIDDFDGCRRYLEVVDAQVLATRAELDTQRDAVAEKDRQVADARRAIAQNRGRIDMCHTRTTQLERTLDQIELDAEDEAAEELALARRG
ncbi:type III secretion protein [Burkholderia stabilis]|uniref:Type III secretion protein n=1 Tax=Burkholderia stabilis TaxID=95485 RepID=A0A4Q2A9H3_9BURK|nr:type III secretion protein [Burkholderia stabilis]RXV65755.1 type III secretion protein [Burkholderia stabilis]